MTNVPSWFLPRAESWVAVLDDPADFRGGTLQMLVEGDKVTAWANGKQVPARLLPVLPPGLQPWLNYNERRAR